MKTQSLKLFTIAFILGLAAVFGAGTIRAQSTMTFETSFDFHVGKDRLAAGRYRFQKLSDGKYLLKNVDSKESRIVFFDLSLSNNGSTADRRVVFNRYDETYFLRGIFEKEGAAGRESIESSFEKKIRTGLVAREDRLAGEKPKPAKASVRLNNK